MAPGVPRFRSTIVGRGTKTAPPVLWSGQEDVYRSAPTNWIVRDARITAWVLQPGRHAVSAWMRSTVSSVAQTALAIMRKLMSAAR